MTIKNKKIPVNYSARDFSSIKAALVEHAKRYYPDSYQDFSEAGFGSLMLDTVAYVGDMLSFYLDYQANESFLETANETDNIIKLAKQLGYKHDNSFSSTGIASFYIFVPASSNGLSPDRRYIPVLKKNSTFSAKNGAQFILVEDVRFDRDTNEIAVARTDENTGLPIYYAIKSYGTVISGKYSSATISVGEFTKFLKVQVPLRNIVEIISVRDSEGFDYYEVENLSQDFVYRPIQNRSDDKKLVESYLRPFYVPRRYVIEKTNDSTFLQFGHGEDPAKTEVYSPADPATVVLKYSARDYISDLTFDPSRLVYSDKFGIVPVNTNLTIVARVNTQADVNIASNTLAEVVSKNFEFEDENNLDQTVLSTIRSSLEVNNEEPILGAASIRDSNQIKKLAFSAASSQGRAVTKQDYQSLVYRMPKKFGSVKRVNVLRDQNSFKRNLNMYIISEDQNGFLAKAPLSLKENLKIWLNNYRIINDTIDILDAKVVNFGINFQITIDSMSSREAVLSRSLSNLREFYNKTPEIGESFFITDVYKVLRNTKGVLDVVSVKITLKNGGVYSTTPFDIESQTSVDGRYINIPDNVLYEIKYPKQDIKGVIV